MPELSNMPELSKEEREALGIGIRTAISQMNTHIAFLDASEGKELKHRMEVYRYFLGIKVNLTSAGIKLGILEAKTTMHSYERRSKKNP